MRIGERHLTFPITEVKRLNKIIIWERRQLLTAYSARWSSWPFPGKVSCTRRGGDACRNKNGIRGRRPPLHHLAPDDAQLVAGVLEDDGDRAHEEDAADEAGLLECHWHGYDPAA